MTLNINGRLHQVMVDPSDTLLDTLRGYQLGLTGTKPGCENGDCGACTVTVQNLPIKSCMVLTAEVDDKPVVTVEGLADHPLQGAFENLWAFQCGYCTSGFLMNAYALLKAEPEVTEARMVEWLRSNICRCTGYQEIHDAVRIVLQDSGQFQQAERGGLE